MGLRERLAAEETVVGTFIKNWIGKLLIVCSVIGGANEYLAVIPPDWIPQWLKITIIICGVVGFTYGKLTVKQPVKTA
jgi:hypothetical protein